VTEPIKLKLRDRVRVKGTPYDFIVIEIGPFAGQQNYLVECTICGGAQWESRENIRKLPRQEGGEMMIEICDINNFDEYNAILNDISGCLMKRGFLYQPETGTGNAHLYHPTGRRNRDG
jgi:hypothetical protein